MSDPLFCVVTNGVASDPAPLPFEATTSKGEPRTDLAGQYAQGFLTLADLADMGLWKATLTEVPYNPDTEAPTDITKTLNTKAKTVACVRGKRPLTAEEIAARQPPAPVPAVLGKVEFITLVQMAGGMTDKMLITAQKDPNFEAFWLKFQMASSVQRDYPTTAGGLDALAAGGYLPNGKAAVLGAWPNA